jgi:hypothetical protein
MEEGQIVRHSRRPVWVEFRPGKQLEPHLVIGGVVVIQESPAYARERRDPDRQSERDCEMDHPSGTHRSILANLFRIFQ